uniref:calcineurin-like phosphoesterase C-terminal domain-containing protein n=1 Tax=Alistipes sp. TaxID=1872444 RepID=UPI0040559D13
MRNILLSITAIIISLALLIGCNPDTNTNAGGKKYGTSLSVSISSTTRTHIGDKIGNSYPIFWSNNDRIVVNGIESEPAIIDSEKANCATFNFNETCSTPYLITYPYCTTTTADAPKVVFSAEQSYSEKMPSAQNLPMCGYATNAGETIQMKHLAGVLRLAIKASEENTQLQKIVISSSDMTLAGEFAVDCQNGTITPSDNTSNTITYTLPANFSLSTSKESVFYIALPAGEGGSCTVEFIVSEEDKMVASWTTNNLTAGVVRELRSLTYRTGSLTSLSAMNAEEDAFVTPEPKKFGYVKDSNGDPIKGVAVSDGFTIVTTDENGYYEIDASSDTWYIYITIPAEYEVPINEHGQPCFFKKYSKETLQYDFTLTPLAGGKETKFALVTFGDPQVQTSSHLNRFKKESIISISSHISQLTKELPCYGITLGDIIWNQDKKNAEQFRDDLREGFSKTKVGLPVFQVMGNHDCNYYNSSNPLYADETSSSFELKAQRNHEDIFGPVNYSFDRGDVHIIGMRDIVYSTNSTSESYQRGFLPAQLKWLQQDLALVPKDKMVVLCVHIPLYNRTDNYIQNVLALLNSYKEAHVISGHTHYIQTLDHKYIVDSPYKNVYEHNVGALCGAWWSCNMCTDGSPNGYGVFTADKNTFIDWYHIGVNNGMNSRNHQMRLYRGNAISGGEKSGKTKGFYTFGFGNDVLVANIYFADQEWKIEVYEDGVYSGDMEIIPYLARPSVSDMAGDGTFDNPYTPQNATSADMYYIGYYLGVLGKSDTSTGSKGAVHHLYKYKLKDKNAKIKVVATDRFGNVYTETKITDGMDYTYTK